MDELDAAKSSHARRWSERNPPSARRRVERMVRDDVVDRHRKSNLKMVPFGPVDRLPLGPPPTTF